MAQMTTLRDLLSRGYFPRELPPMFTTDGFASLITSTNVLPADFARPNKLSRPNAKIMKHDIPNLKLRRRVAGIPNPLFYFLLCQDVVNYWGDIQNHLNKSTLSRSKSIANSQSGRAINREYSEDKLLRERLFIRSRSQYLLKTDIAQFYPSIYTHSIPWAIHTKTISKQHRKATPQFFGNILDEDSRNLQDGQTQGIPIGTDTSLIIAEILLTAFDEELKKQMPNLLGFRYVDDFELGFKTPLEAENCLGLIGELLRDFELILNDKKTRIIEIPHEVNELWVAELRNYKFRTPARSQMTDIFAFIDKAVCLAKANESGHVLKYAIKILGNLKPATENWELIQNFLLECLIAESNTFYSVITIFREHENNYPIDRVQLGIAMNMHIQRHCPHHVNEVCWALWGVLHWNLQLESKSVEVLSKMDDSAVALMTLHANQEGLISSNLDTTKWDEIVQDPDELYGSQWLLAYEANIKGWLPKCHKITDPNFEFLLSNQVEFYDISRKEAEFTGVKESDISISLFSF
jgi:hypothetical protein